MKSDENHHNHLPGLAWPQAKHLCQSWPGFLWSGEVAPSRSLFLLQEVFFSGRKFLQYSLTCAKVRCGLKCRKALQQTGIVGWFGWSSGSCQSPAEESVRFKREESLRLEREKVSDVMGWTGFQDNLIDMEDCWGIEILLWSLHWCRHPKDLFFQRPIPGKQLLHI